MLHLCSPICRPRDSADSRHSLASNRGYQAKAVAVCGSVSSSAFLTAVFCLFVTQRMHQRPAFVRFSERIHSFTSTPSGSCGRGLAVLPAVLSRCCPFPVHGDIIATSPRGGRAALKVKTIFAALSSASGLRLTSFQLSGCVQRGKTPQ